MQLPGRHDEAPSAEPPRLDPATIRRVRFRVVPQGFDVDETCLFLSDVADHVERLEARIARLETQLDTRDATP